MKKARLALALMRALLFSLVIVTSLVSVVIANPLSPPSYPETPDKNQPTITIILPAGNKSYNANSIGYSFVVQKPLSWFSDDEVHGDLTSVSYVLDGKRVDVSSRGLDEQHYDSTPMSFNGTLSGLGEEEHSLQVLVRSASYYLDPNRPTSGYGWWLYPPANYFIDTYSATVFFIVDTTQPAITILSIENKTYFTTEIPLSFVVSEPLLRVVNCLDDLGNMTIAGNCTLSGLSDGSHDLTIYASDAAGNTGASETIKFTTAQQTKPQSPSPTVPFPTSFLIASITAVVLFGAGLLVYLVKRKRLNTRAWFDRLEDSKRLNGSVLKFLFE